MTLIFFLAFAVLLLLWVGSARSKQQADNPDADIAALIAHHDAHPADSAEAQAEAEHRLYHEIRQLQHSASAQQRMPWWIALLAPLLLAGVTFLWYVPLGGHIVLGWHSLQQQLAPALSRSLYLGDLPQAVSETGMHTYCQSLQTRVDRTDPDQLDTLGQCYSQYGNHAAAADVYRQLRRLLPNDKHAALSYAQASLFADPDQGMSREVENLLVHLYAENPDDTLTGILLATAYTRGGEDAKALPVWQTLKARTPQTHEFYSLIERTEAQLAARNNTAASPAGETPAPATTDANTITVTIPPALLARLPEGAQLFVMLAAKDNPMPLAVQKHDPRETQSITFHEADSMTGAEFLQRDDLVVRAILSASGDVTGERLGEIREDFTPGENMHLHFAAP